MSIYVYSKQGCPFCSLLKMELDKRGFAFTEIDLSDDSIRQEFYANTGLSTVPQVYISDEECDLTAPTGKNVGGWSEVSKSWDSLASSMQ